MESQGTTPQAADVALDALIARAKAAAGPDPALEGRIFAALFGGVASKDCPDRTRSSYSGQAYFTNIDRPYVLIEDTRHAEPVTASLDAALALVERVLPDCWPGFQKNAHVGDGSRWSAWIERPGAHRDEDVEASARTPALALVLATLHALSRATPAVDEKSRDQIK